MNRRAATSWTDLLPPIGAVVEGSRATAALPTTRHMHTAHEPGLEGLQRRGWAGARAGCVRHAMHANLLGLAEGNHGKEPSARLGRRQRHERLGQLGLQLVKHGRADALGTAPHNACDLAAARVATQAHLVDRWPERTH